MVENYLGVFGDLDEGRKMADSLHPLGHIGEADEGLVALPQAGAGPAVGQASAPRMMEVEAFRVGASLQLRTEVRRTRLRPLPTVRFTARKRTVPGVRERLDGNEPLACRIDFDARVPGMGRGVGDAVRVVVRACTARVCRRVVRVVEIEPAHDR
jgi:hypothetical protein